MSEQRTRRVKWLGRGGSKTVELPVPLVSLSERTGSVTLNPEGDVPEGDAIRLVGDGTGLFVFVDAAPDVVKDILDGTHATPVAPEPELSGLAQAAIDAEFVVVKEYESKGIAAMQSAKIPGSSLRETTGGTWQIVVPKGSVEE